MPLAVIDSSLSDPIHSTLSKCSICCNMIILDNRDTVSWLPTLSFLVDATASMSRHYSIMQLRPLLRSGMRHIDMCIRKRNYHHHSFVYFISFNICVLRVSFFELFLCFFIARYGTINRIFTTQCSTTITTITAIMTIAITIIEALCDLDFNAKANSSCKQNI